MLVPMTSTISWREIQRQNFTDCADLIDFLELDKSLCERVLVKSHFPLNVPLRLAQKMAKNTLDDPLVRQFLPLKDEELMVEGYAFDAVQDGLFRKETRLLHKYEGRALLLTTAACAMNCRFCFRRNFDYAENENFFEQELKAIQNDPSLSEIILSGGDPLALSNEKLGKLFQKLSQIPHLKRLRFHTRFPIGIPERIDDAFLEILERSPLQIFFVIHCNHPNELDDEIFAALKRIQKLGIPVLNQNVLLKGVNDDLPTLKTLMELLVDQGILPYYLNQLDQVHGAAHFEVEEQKGRELMGELARSLSGYAVPRYVREIPGKAQKTKIQG